jgi:hypothetical protein
MTIEDTRKRWLALYFSDTDLFRPPPAPRQHTLWVQVAARGAAARGRDDEMRDAA